MKPVKPAFWHPLPMDIQPGKLALDNFLCWNNSKAVLARLELWSSAEIGFSRDASDGVKFGRIEIRDIPAMLSYTSLNFPTSRQSFPVKPGQTLGELCEILVGKSAKVVRIPAWSIAPWWRSKISGSKLRILSAGKLLLDEKNVVSYAESRLAGKSFDQLNLDERRAAIIERVHRITDEYQAMQEDIVTRIDLPALFDSAAPLTAAFQTALVTFEDFSQRPIPELERAAGEVEMTFAVARQHAERVGISHLPKNKRDDARRAAKAAQLLRSGSTAGERQAALTQLNAILARLALYYLPPVKEIHAIE